jgi:hypothetical protein
MAGQLPEHRVTVSRDGLLEQRAGGPELVSAAACFPAVLSAPAPGQRLGGVAVAVDDDAAVAAGSAPRGRDDAAAGGGLDLVQVGSSPGAVGGEGLDSDGPARGEVRTGRPPVLRHAAVGNGVYVSERHARTRSDAAGVADARRYVIDRAQRLIEARKRLSVGS